jgi:single stranded DNA-binding protein
VLQKSEIEQSKSMAACGRRRTKAAIDISRYKITTSLNINKIFLLGNLTREPELKALTNGGPIAKFALATNRTHKKNGEESEYHNVVVFGRQVESCAQYLRKGSIAHVEGRIQTRSWKHAEKGRFRSLTYNHFKLLFRAVV